MGLTPAYWQTEHLNIAVSATSARKCKVCFPQLTHLKPLPFPGETGSPTLQPTNPQFEHSLNDPDTSTWSVSSPQNEHFLPFGTTASPLLLAIATHWASKYTLVCVALSNTSDRHMKSTLIGVGICVPCAIGVCLHSTPIAIQSRTSRKVRCLRGGQDGNANCLHRRRGPE